MPCLAKEQTRKMRMWTYLSSAGEEPPIILYHFTPTKAGEHVRQFLKGWSGYLHADAASNYDELYRQNPHIQEVACWAHARRKFYEIAEHAPTRVLAHEAVEQINALFAIERQAREDKLTPDEIRRRREQLAKPIVDEIKTWLEKHRPKLAPAAPTARAMNYLINHWGAFARYLDDGRLKLDNNAAERALRLAAIGRKNYLFVGNERSGEVTATLLSLIETAKANGLEPLGYLTRAMRELPLIDPEASDAGARYEALLPI
jgi:transposase